MRTQGAKGKPKTFKELVGLLQQAAEAEGIEMTVDVKEKIAKAAGEIAEAKGESGEIAAREIRSKFDSLELTLDDSEIDTYTCGVCKHSMGSELSECPECGSKLNW